MSAIIVRIGRNTLILLNLFLMISVFVNIVMISQFIQSRQEVSRLKLFYSEPETGWGRGVPVSLNVLSSSLYSSQSMCSARQPCSQEVEAHKEKSAFYSSKIWITPGIRSTAVQLISHMFPEHAICGKITDENPATSMRATYCREAVSLYYGIRDNITYVTGPLKTCEIDEVCQDSVQTLDLGAGKCDEQAVLLVSLLRSVGVDSSLVLLNTDKSFIECVESNCTIQSADHAMVVARLEGLEQLGMDFEYWYLNNDADTILLDPTCKTCRFGELPALDRERMVWVV